MKQLLYVLQFKGQAVPAGAANLLKASTSAPSCNIATVVGAEGVQGTLQPAAGGSATFESQVTLTGGTAFQESGSITFGEGGHRLHFSTVGEGYLAPSPEPGLQHGAVTWRIDRGEGQLAGATGLITSNFFAGAGGEITDNHFGVIFLP